MTWADILAESLRSLKEPSDASGHWSAAELLRRANMGMREFARITKCLVTIDSVTSTAGTGSYSKAATCLELRKISYDSVRLIRIPKADLDAAERIGRIGSPWTSEQGTPKVWVDEKSTYTLYPIPDTSSITIAREWVALPTDMTAVGDIPFNSVSYLYDYHQYLVSYIAWKCLLEDQNEFFKEHKADFYNGVGRAKSDFLYRGDELGTFSSLRRHSSGSKSQPIPGVNI